MNAPIRTSRLVPLLVAALLASCSLGKSVTPDEYASYTLEFEPSRPNGAALAWQLGIEQPEAPDALASSRIATRESDGSYGVLRGARWSERAPELLQSALLRVFEDSGRLRGVGRTSAVLRSDYALQTELRAFEADYRKGGAEARLALSAKLVRAGPRDVVAARVFEQAVPVQGGGGRAVATAFGQAAAKLLPELRDWVLEAGQADYAASSGPGGPAPPKR
jgi:cholesterol transport system auxiliary component